MRLGNIGFVSKAKTSGICPVCKEENLRHGTICPDCKVDLTNIMHSNDGIAGFNIAKRGFDNFNKEVRI
jgi:predicted amidophosphoribosyltransferase